MSRKKRISSGSGNSIDQIHAFVRQFEQMRKMMHKMSKMPGMGMPPGGPAGAPGKRLKR
jgi:signal recognition particle subunit SRP54